MATVTVSLIASGEPARTNPNTGLTCRPFVSGNVTFGGSTDVMRLARMPNQARIVDVTGYVQCAATSVQGVLVVAEVLANGTLSARSTLCSISAVTAGGAIKTGIFIPAKVSLSDDAAVQYAMLAIVASGGTQSTSFSINGAILYDTTGTTS